MNKSFHTISGQRIKKSSSGISKICCHFCISSWISLRISRAVLTAWDKKDVEKTKFFDVQSIRSQNMLPIKFFDSFLFCWNLLLWFAAILGWFWIPFLVPLWASSLCPWPVETKQTLNKQKSVTWIPLRVRFCSD